MANSRKVPDVELELDVRAYYDQSGDRSAAARSRGLKRQTYNDRIRMAENRLGIKLGKVADGRIAAVAHVKAKLPKKGHVARYILTSIQNNTHLHPGFNNILAYRDWLESLEDGTCQLMVGTFSYQKASYGVKAVKRGKHDRADSEPLWYAPEAEPFIVDHSVELAPGLVWCGEQNILPTNKLPLRGMEDYNGRSSNIIPHAKIAMDSVASMADEAVKFNYTTGTVTQQNYIQKRVGIMAEQHHNYGAVLVEVDDGGNWWVRQLHIGSDDEVMDVGPRGYSGVHVQTGEVHAELVTEAINWADSHAAEMELWVRELVWGDGGMLDTLHPRKQFMNDVFSMRSRGHHDMKDFHRTYEKHTEEEESVEDEIGLTAVFLSDSVRPWCETVVVHSNHDRHLDRWLNEADFRRDPINARYFCLLQYTLLSRKDRGDKDFSVLEWALKQKACPKGVRFLAPDESFVILKDKLGGIECALHGDQGPNGSRGTTSSLTKLGRAVTKGHDHKATIQGQVYSAGACSLDFPYMSGPHSHSVSHVVAYKNSTRSILTMWDRRWRA